MPIWKDQFVVGSQVDNDTAVGFVIEDDNMDVVDLMPEEVDEWVDAQLAKHGINPDTLTSFGVAPRSALNAIHKKSLSPSANIGESDDEGEAKRWWCQPQRPKPTDEGASPVKGATAVSPTKQSGEELDYEDDDNMEEDEPVFIREEPKFNKMEENPAPMKRWPDVRNATQKNMHRMMRMMNNPHFVPTGYRPTQFIAPMEMRRRGKRGGNRARRNKKRAQANTPSSMKMGVQQTINDQAQ